MKQLLLLALLTAGVAPTLRAQEYKTRFANRQDRRLIMEMRGSDVVVETYDGDEVLIKGGTYEAPPKRAEGLRPVYQSTEDNTRQGLAVSAEGNTLRVQQVARKEAIYTLRVPRNTSLTFREGTWTGSNLTVTNLSGSLELAMKNGNATLLGITGPVVANSTSGDVTLQLAPGAQGPTAVSLISGNLDVTLPTATKATVSLRSMSGEVYTDFDLNPKPTPDGLARVGGQTVTVPLNGGGFKMTLNTISGNVFLRKAK
ncbi:DUF4097 family beta strand repeat-containing protein [Hymenobacter metallilatus]|uniref:DUF4097 domain-containing protein n=1 Tax=Hymenobacter metallilatus TaxID=2493666 RepID=A0A428JSP8_9BACT|nr:DUF4097 family beta strand repeat-containing protein [Hymenobacter metallilatus]RSK37109.1 hypothetical protein EI290_00125 [Hymenobacter metallilatus]